MKPVLIIRTGRAPDSIRARHGDFPHWFRLAAGLRPERLRIVDVAAGETLPAAGEVAGAIVTGSAAMVTEKLPWSEATAGWIRDASSAGEACICSGAQSSRQQTQRRAVDCRC